MKILILFMGLFFMSSMIMAQETNSETLVQYDPLFWKDKLKLDPEQCQRIREINGEYYESLFTAYKEEKNDRNELRMIVNRSLQQRSHEIWETFHPKQRKRWKRMWNES